MERKKLTETEVNSYLKKLPGWRYEDGKLKKDYEFSDFAETFAFMTRAAIISEKMDHHPGWSNAYNLLSIDLTTHDAGGVTAFDIRWATDVDAPLAIRE